MIDEKVSVLTPQGLYRYGKGWTEVEGLTCSNDNFDNSSWGTYVWKGGKTSIDSDVSGQMTLVEDGCKDFREARLRELREQNLELENGRRNKNGESELNMDEYELLYEDEKNEGYDLSDEDEFDEKPHDGYGGTD